MGPSYDEGNYLQSPGTLEFMGHPSIICVVRRPHLGPLQVPKFQVPTTCGLRVSGQYKMYPQHSCVPIEAPRDTDTRVVKDPIEAVKKLQDQETNHPTRHTQSLKTLTKIFSGITEKLPEDTPPQAQISTNPTQPNAFRTATRNHQQFTRSNTPGIISVPV